MTKRFLSLYCPYHSELYSVSYVSYQSQTCERIGVYMEQNNYVQGVKTNGGMGCFYTQGTGLCSFSAKVIIQLEGKALLTSFTWTSND